MAKRALRRAPRSAFTLIEIVLVLTIIAVLVAAGIKLLTGNVEFAQETRVESDIQNFASQLQLYEARNFSVPSTEDPTLFFCNFCVICVGSFCDVGDFFVIFV